jgi:hypothetical protein
MGGLVAEDRILRNLSRQGGSGGPAAVKDNQKWPEMRDMDSRCRLEGTRCTRVGDVDRLGHSAKVHSEASSYLAERRISHRPQISPESEKSWHAPAPSTAGQAAPVVCPCNIMTPAAPDPGGAQASEKRSAVSLIINSWHGRPGCAFASETQARTPVPQKILRLNADPTNSATPDCPESSGVGAVGAGSRSPSVTQ